MKEYTVVRQGGPAQESQEYPYWGVPIIRDRLWETPHIGLGLQVVFGVISRSWVIESRPCRADMNAGGLCFSSCPDAAGVAGTKQMPTRKKRSPRSSGAAVPQFGILVQSSGCVGFSVYDSGSRGGRVSGFGAGVDG